MYLTMMATPIYVFIFISFFIFYVFRKLKKRIISSILIHKLPGPEGLPILGNLFLIAYDNVTLFKKTRHWAEKYGPMYKLSATDLFVSINITGAEEFEKIASTTKNIQKSIEYAFLRRWLGEGLLTSTGSKWHTRRKILTPAFHFKVLQQFIGVFNKETKRMINDLQNEIDKPWTNVVPFVSQFTLYAITETSMGTTLNMENKDDKRYISAVYQIGKVIFRRMMRPWLYIESIYKLFPSRRIEIGLVETLHAFTDKIVSKRAATFEKFELDEDNNYSSPKKKLVFLDLLLNAKLTDGIIDDQGIREEVNTFLFEGHDTTAMSISFTLMLLANYRNYQELIYKEILSVVGPNKEVPDLSDLNEMKFMERCIKESLRLYPSVSFIARTLEEDTVINNQFLPKRSVVHIHIYDIHRNPKYWTNPDKFDPDRFLPENCLNRHPFSYVPFSAGPRNCIGQKFAILEIKAVLCGIIKNFVLLPVDTPDTIDLVPDLVLRTKDASLKVKFCKRNVPQVVE